MMGTCLWLTNGEIARHAPHRRGNAAHVVKTMYLSLRCFGSPKTDGDDLLWLSHDHVLSGAHKLRHYTRSLETPCTQH